MRLFQIVTEHRRLPRLVRIFRVWQAASIVLLIIFFTAGLVVRPPMIVMNILMLIPGVPLLISVFAVGLLTWRNYHGTAEIWAENVRSRGLEEIGIGWVMDTGTARAIGAGKVIITSLFAASALIQILL